MTTVLAIGIAVLDDVYPLKEPLARGMKHRTGRMETVMGGNAANIAVAVTNLGGRAHLVTRLGDDLVGAMLRDLLEKKGIGTALVRTILGCRSARSAIALDPDGERTVINFADPSMPEEPDFLPSSLPEGIRAVTGDTRWEKGTRRVFELARRHGLPAVFDGDRQVLDPSLMDLATHVGFSAQGLREMTHTDDLAEGLKRIGARHSAYMAVTDGSRGVLALEGGAIRHYPAFPVTAIDTLGAGDVWHGALAYALADGMPVERAIPFASATAALKCTRLGGSSGAPNRYEVELLLKGH